jgi:hypothetical protein
MRFADNLRYALCRFRLMQRRKVVVRTLDHLDAEREIVDTNRQWKSPSTQRKRRRLLDEIHGWYGKELKKIDMVLERLNHSSNHVEKKLS